MGVAKNGDSFYPLVSSIFTMFYSPPPVLAAAENRWDVCGGRPIGGYLRTVTVLAKPVSFTDKNQKSAIRGKGSISFSGGFRLFDFTMSHPDHF